MAAFPGLVRHEIPNSLIGAVPSTVDCFEVLYVRLYNYVLIEHPLQGTAFVSFSDRADAGALPIEPAPRGSVSDCAPLH